MMNYAASIAALGDDETLWLEIAELFQAGRAEHVAKLQAALDREDSVATARELHKLRGSVAFFCDEEVTETLQESETLSMRGALNAQARARLVTALEAFCQALDAQLNYLQRANAV